MPHPSYDTDAFFLFDAGVVVLDEPVSMSQYGDLPEEGELDEFLTGPKNDQLFTAVGYGLNESGPFTAEGGDVRFQGTLMLVNLQGTASRQGPRSSSRATRASRTREGLASATRAAPSSARGQTRSSP